ncbi:MAG: hypothetical protein A3G18_06600 [Rhodospirillales bacterium RIFCSPLOWO2_12_FULL_58_28]|nr:MAG: hypothetical protein A3H92_06365 [Rhodospirillales bacterium RIFCSPLOWO2_02_FULL_58_16]OHC79389.1 MAG: hypothetical protein A3G18_06600 [Rhodospirillales bacterium RIFCSPLOWO2_12_FULL_58_28]
MVSDAGESVPVTVIAQGEYEAMVDRMDDMEAAAAYHATRDEESVPAEMVAALVNGENPVRVWRKHRRLTQQALADAASIGKPYVCEIEAGKKEPSVKTLKALARVLGCDLDDLA